MAVVSKLSGILILPMIFFNSNLPDSVDRRNNIKVNSPQKTIGQKVQFFQKEVIFSNHKYDNTKAISYAKLYALKNDNSCGKYFNDPTKKLSDCAHFIAHCLNAGGIKIKNSDPNLQICPDGLSVRVTEIIDSLRKLANEYDNIKEIDFSDAIVGDYGFLRTFLIRPSHAFMICESAVEKKDFKVFGHTTNRNCEKSEPSWYHDFYTAFRVTDY